MEVGQTKKQASDVLVRRQDRQTEARVSVVRDREGEQGDDGGEGDGVVCECHHQELLLLLCASLPLSFGSVLVVVVVVVVVCAAQHLPCPLVLLLSLSHLCSSSSSSPPTIAADDDVVAVVMVVVVPGCRSFPTTRTPPSNCRGDDEWPLLLNPNFTHITYHSPACLSFPTEAFLYLY